ncbi:MAG: Uma2 family endonuclease [Oscillatoria sp. SIO1A7]|nr:Uma2 family endonuclease [Oscillatoria sp. SIO1A7]
MTFTIARSGQILRYNVSWQELEEILAEREDSSATRLAYDRETLEIIRPLPEHEYFKEIIGDLIKDLAEELDIDYESFGSTTWKREDKLAGVEPDNCFYIEKEPLIRGRLDIDLRQDPPPDLVLEIDLTSKSLDRQPIYARLGVPEMWRYDKGKLLIYRLESGDYAETETSLFFAEFPVKKITVFVRDNLGIGRRAIRKKFRAWVKSEK